MMLKTLFFSWQSDLPETRGVIRWALEKAARELNKAGGIEEALRVDEDTAGVPGWPDVTASILAKIESCGVFVADLTPINGPESKNRLTPNPKVMLELGYALATGAQRLRIICIVNTAYLPDKDISRLPFDVRGSRPLTFFLDDRSRRPAHQGDEDPVRSAARQALAAELSRAIQSALEAVAHERDARVLAVTPHLLKSGDQFQVAMQLQTGAPFEFSYRIKEPSGNLLSFMMSTSKVDPKTERMIRSLPMTLKSLTPPNDLYVLAGCVAHLPTADRSVPPSRPFEVHYRLVDAGLVEVSRQQFAED